MYNKELLKGSTNTILLSLLAERSMYGYEIVKELELKSSGYFRFKEGTLYPALHRLERDKLVAGNWTQTQNGQQRRYYLITEKGKEALESMLKEWSMFYRAVNRVAQAGAV